DDVVHAGPSERDRGVNRHVPARGDGDAAAAPIQAAPGGQDAAPLERDVPGAADQGEIAPAACAQVERGRDREAVGRCEIDGATGGRVTAGGGVDLGAVDDDVAALLRGHQHVAARAVLARVRIEHARGGDVTGLYVDVDEAVAAIRRHVDDRVRGKSDRPR